MRLYKLTNDFAQLFERFDEISELDGDMETYQQAWFDTLSGIEEEFEVKAENMKKMHLLNAAKPRKNKPNG